MEKQERAARRILEERKNSEFAKKMKPVYAFMNRFSLVFHALLACVINFAIEAISRHSVIAAGEYMIGTPLVFLYNAFMIFITFSVVYFFKRRIFVRIIISVIWLILGVANGYMLLKRVTPFNAQDLKAASEGLSLISNYFNGFELIILVVGIAAVIVWVISMWKRGGQYSGKVHRVRALIGVIICAASMRWCQTRRWISGWFPLTLGISLLPMKITGFLTALWPVFSTQGSTSPTTTAGNDGSDQQ